MKFRQRLTEAARGFLRRNGYEVTRSRTTYAQLLDRYRIDVVFDVGANIGQFASSLRRRGYTGRIVSFEPLAASYAELAERAKNDPLWETFQLGLADYDGTALMNRSKHTVFSSLATINAAAMQIYAGATVVGQEHVQVRRLDSLFRTIRRDSTSVLLKCDTQGTEKQVLAGAATCLAEITGLHLELSYEPLYDGELCFDEMLQYVKRFGFELVLLEPLLQREANRILQGDGTFFRRAPAEPSRGPSLAVPTASEAGLGIFEL